MGLYIQTLEDIPEEITVEKDYYIYLLEYNWNEPIGEALANNYSNLINLSSEAKSVVIRSTKRTHFADEVLSWHNINGLKNTDELLPAILITNKHPSYFRIGNSNEVKNQKEFKFVLIPLRKICKTTSDIINLIEEIFQDIKQNKEISNFRISKELNKGFGKTLVDSLILEPNFNGVGIKIKDIINYFKK